MDNPTLLHMELCFNAKKKKNIGTTVVSRQLASLKDGIGWIGQMDGWVR